MALNLNKRREGTVDDVPQVTPDTEIETPSEPVQPVETPSEPIKVPSEPVQEIGTQMYNFRLSGNRTFNISYKDGDRIIAYKKDGKIYPDYLEFALKKGYLQ